jgi:hypothetical protein
MIQLGGGRCSLCQSPGTNKTTCPLNPSATNKNLATHPLAGAVHAPVAPVAASAPRARSPKARVPRAPRAQVYDIHNNGGVPFKVSIGDGEAIISKADKSWTTYTEFKRVLFEKAFIGKSPEIEMTIDSGGAGPEFDGNSILLHLGGKDYLYIGSEIYSFKTDVPIVDYVSPVGNSDVPYPYAVDAKGQYWLMLENLVLSGVGQTEDPYRIYYEQEISGPVPGMKARPFKSTMVHKRL